MGIAPLPVVARGYAGPAIAAPAIATPAIRYAPAPAIVAPAIAAPAIAAPAIAAPAAIAGGYGYARGYGWAGPQGLGAAPLGLRVHPNGAVTPNDEPAVAAAKADHFAAGGGRSLGPIAYAAAPAIAAHQW